MCIFHSAESHPWLCAERAQPAHGALSAPKDSMTHLSHEALCHIFRRAAGQKSARCSLPSRSVFALRCRRLLRRGGPGTGSAARGRRRKGPRWRKGPRRKRGRRCPAAATGARAPGQVRGARAGEGSEESQGSDGSRARGRGRLGPRGGSPRPPPPPGPAVTGLPRCHRPPLRE